MIFKNKIINLIFILLLSVVFGCDNRIDSNFGWTVGTYTDYSSAVILKTEDGGINWQIQESSELLECEGADVSAVDSKTAWVALTCTNASFPAKGKILYTSDGGSTWINQLDSNFNEGVKNIRAINKKEAWAVTLEGTVLHTRNSGRTWNLVPTGDVYDGVGSTRLVNRLTVKGDSIWFVDHYLKQIVHSPDKGLSWQLQEVDASRPYVAGEGLHMVNAYDSSVAFTSFWYSGDIYRTLDAGQTWDKHESVLGPNDIDDLIAVTADNIWGVLNTGISSKVFSAEFNSDNEMTLEAFTNTNIEYFFSGISAIDVNNVTIVGTCYSCPEDYHNSSIYQSIDAGDTWLKRTIPDGEYGLWKVSFVGENR